MAINIRDKEIDDRLDQIVKNIYRQTGIKCTKTDAIRFLLRMKKQGKKTDPKWRKII